MKKIVFVIPNLGNGGSERVISILSNSLYTDYDISVLFTKSREEMYFLNDKIKKVYNDKSTNVFGQIRFLRKYFKKNKPDYVISFFTYQNIYSLIAAIGVKTKVIVSERNDPSKNCYRHKKIEILRSFFTH